MWGFWYCLDGIIEWIIGCGVLSWDWCRGGGGGGDVMSGVGGGYSFVACLTHLTVDHASIWQRSTVPTRNTHVEHLGAHYVVYILRRNFLGVWCCHDFAMLLFYHISRYWDPSWVRTRAYFALALFLTALDCSCDGGGGSTPFCVMITVLHGLCDHLLSVLIVMWDLKIEALRRDPEWNTPLKVFDKPWWWVLL